MNKAVFIDKDGTLIPDIPYNTNPALMSLNEHAAYGLAALQDAGYMIIVITNQSGIALGYFTEDRLEPVKEKIEKMLSNSGIRLDGFLYCPHYPEGSVQKYSIDCECRKPKPGMLFEGALRWNIHLNSSWMIGDILNDVEAGNRAGCKSILIDNGGETEWQTGVYRTPDYVAKNILEAADYILKKSNERELGWL